MGLCNTCEKKRSGKCEGNKPWEVIVMCEFYKKYVPDTDFGEFAKDTNVPSNAEFKTVYGYPVENLVLFADACKKAGIDNEELKRFCDNAESAWMYAWDEFKRKQDKALRDIMSGMTGGAEGG